jgi:hypothetical protein
MARFPSITVRHPRPHDLVDDPVRVVGVGTGFEGDLSARLRDASGRKLAEEHFRAGGTGIWGNFEERLRLSRVPRNPQGTLEVFEHSAKDGSEIHKRTVPIVFGRSLIDPFMGFAQHRVKRGETLRSISSEWFGSANHWRRIFEANRNVLDDPDEVRAGQVLRIPQ